MFRRRIAMLLALVVLLAVGTRMAMAREGDFGQTEEQLADPESRLVEVTYDLSQTGELVAEPDGEPEADESVLTTAAEGSVEEMVANMTLDEKIAQMIVPAFRTWNGADVTTLPDELAEVLRRHQYGGIALFNTNMKDAAQTARLVGQLQANNAQTTATTNVPYLVCADGEGSVVVRLLSGTRMNGSMAVGATGAKAQENAFDTGRVLGEELAAVGVNVDLAPDADVNSNPSNPVIGTRAFSDEPTLVADLANAFARGLESTGVVPTYKHFPGHGDTDTDTHTALTSVNKSYDELNATDLVPFRKAVQNGADLIMTAHITLPQYDEQVTLGDGTHGYYPATMSPKVIGELLRGDLGFDGVVMTDALEMGAIVSGMLVPGFNPSLPDVVTLEYAANVAEKIINAGVDILLMPADLNDSDKAAFYDAYVAALVTKVQAGDIDEARIDESVTRILRLKQKHGVLDMDPTVAPDGDAATAIVGSAEHRETEMRIAREAITLLKNRGLTLPLSGHNTKVVIAGRDASDAGTIVYALKNLQGMGLIPRDACINNLDTGAQTGSTSSKTTITIGHYYNQGSGVVDYSDALRSAVSKADVVVALTKSYGVSSMVASSGQYQGASQLLADAHAAGARFVQLSNNLPYDVTRYQDADAILLAYMTAGLGADPTDSSGNLVAYNANVVAAIEALFDNMPPTGQLPVTVPNAVEAEDGSISYTSEPLFERGFGLSYEYRFTKGTGSKHKKGTKGNLAFVNNARHDLMQRVMVDGKQVPSAGYVSSPGSTNITLKAIYLNTLKVGKHKLVTVHDYGTREVTLETNFVITAGASTSTDSGDDADDGADEGTKPHLEVEELSMLNHTPATKPPLKTTGVRTTATTSKLPQTGDVLTCAPLLAGLGASLVGLGIRRRRR